MNDHRIIWLASFPKSGNTWVRAFLANYFVGGRKPVSINKLHEFTTGDVRADFYDRAAGGKFSIQSIEDYFALRPKALRLIHDARSGSVFVKTHQINIVQDGIELIPAKLTGAAIYILRNPFDVAPSFARHAGTTIDEAIAKMSDPNGHSASPRGLFEIYGSWDAHVTSWTEAKGLPRSVVRYEDLRDDPKAGFTKVLDFLRVKPDPVQLRNALKNTRLDALQQQEKTEGFHEKPNEMSSFFHKGQVGGWRSELNNEQVARLFEAFESKIRKWYPEFADEAAEIAGRSGS